MGKRLQFILCMYVCMFVLPCVCVEARVCVLACESALQNDATEKTQGRDFL